jgi:hypothetical protein
MTNKLLKTIALGAAIFAGANAFAEGGIEKAVKPAKQENEVIATIALPFSYESQRNEKENNGKLFFYNFLSDGTAYQIDKPNVKFAQRWFWDVDGDGKFGDAEQGAIKDGKLIYMSDKFNEKANSEQRKFLQNIENSSQYSSKNLTGKTWGVTGLDDADANGDGDVTPEELNKYYGFDKKIEEAKLLEKKVSQEPTLPKEKIKLENSLSITGGANFSKDSFDIMGGLKYGFTKNLSASVIARQGWSSDRNLSHNTTPKFASGIYGEGSEDESERTFNGIGGELQFGPVIAGGGANFHKSTIDTIENFMKDGKIIKPNSYSKSESKIVPYFNAGLELKIKEVGIGARVFFPLSSDENMSFGLGLSYKIKRGN